MPDGAMDGCSGSSADVFKRIVMFMLGYLQRDGGWVVQRLNSTPQTHTHSHTHTHATHRHTHTHRSHPSTHITQHTTCTHKRKMPIPDKDYGHNMEKMIQYDPR